MKHHYINNNTLYNEVKASLLNGKPSPMLSQMFIEMVDNILRDKRFNKFRNYDKDDIKQECLLRCLTVYVKYDLNHHNAFAYFTQVILNRAIDTIKLFDKTANFVDITKFYDL